jgi:Spermidine/putrescine-binding periplasmic protein
MKKFRQILLVALAALTVFGVTSCASKTSKKQYASSITLFNWTEYMPKSVLQSFQKKYGITVKQPTFSSNEEMIAKLQAGGTSQYDISVPSNFFIQRMIQSNMVQKIDKSEIPNLKNISPAFLKRDWDPKNDYSVPYLSSPTTIAVNTATCKVKIKTYNDLINPALKGSIVCGMDERGLVGIALKALGYSSQSAVKSQILATEPWLKKLKANIISFDADSPKSEMISGDASVGLMWSGEAALAIDSNPKIRLVWPDDKGIIISVDNFVLLKTSKKKLESELFINYLLDAKVSAQIAVAYPYLNPNEAAKKYFTKAFLANPASNIAEKYVNTAEWATNAGNAQQYYDKVYQDVMS